MKLVVAHLAAEAAVLVAVLVVLVAVLVALLMQQALMAHNLHQVLMAIHDMLRAVLAGSSPILVSGTVLLNRIPPAFF